MINLSGNGLSIEVEEDNPIYSILSKFEGESFTVIKIEEPEKNEETKNSSTLIQEEEEKTYKTIKRKDVWEKFYNEVPYDTENEKENSLIYVLLKSHVENVLRGDKGDVEFEEVGNKLYKKDGYYLIGDY